MALDTGRGRFSRWWLYAVVAYLLSAMPAALTVDRHDALRLSTMPVCIAVPPILFGCSFSPAPTPLFVTVKAGPRWRPQKLSTNPT